MRIATVLAEDVREEIEARIDAEQVGRELLARCAQMSELDRSAIELVDLAGLTPREAASALAISPATLRVRLSGRAPPQKGVPDAQSL